MSIPCHPGAGRSEAQQFASSCDAKKHPPPGWLLSWAGVRRSAVAFPPGVGAAQPPPWQMGSEAGLWQLWPETEGRPHPPRGTFFGLPLVAPAPSFWGQGLSWQLHLFCHIPVPPPPGACLLLLLSRAQNASQAGLCNWCSHPHIGFGC